MNSLVLIFVLVAAVFIYDMITGNVKAVLDAARRWCIAAIQTVKATLECIGNCVKL